MRRTEGEADDVVPDVRFAGRNSFPASLSRFLRCASDSFVCELVMMMQPGTLIEVVRTLYVIVKYCRVGYMEIPFAGVHVPGTRACVRGGKGI